jgi:hypothetical protein
MITISFNSQSKQKKCLYDNNYWDSRANYCDRRKDANGFFIHKSTNTAITNNPLSLLITIIVLSMFLFLIIRDQYINNSIDALIAIIILSMFLLFAIWELYLKLSKKS